MRHLIDNLGAGGAGRRLFDVELRIGIGGGGFEGEAGHDVGEERVRFGMGIHCRRSKGESRFRLALIEEKSRE